MTLVFQKIPLLLEFFLNGIFIFVYSLKSMDKIPETWNLGFIDKVLELGAWFVPLVILVGIVINLFNLADIEKFVRRHIFSIVVFVPLVITWGDVQFAFLLSAAHLMSSILSLYDNIDDSSDGKVYLNSKSSLSTELFGGFHLRPAQLVLISFSVVILLGTFALMLPVSTVSGKSLAFIDGLFMATSATCVTGLSTVSLMNDFTMFGQLVILLLIQIGGLSIMTLVASMTILLGKSMQMKERMIMQDLLDVSSLEELFEMILGIIKYTFFIELWGAIVLTIAFSLEGFEFSRALYYGFFHSISAFCNAGFALFDSSLESYATSPLIHGTIAILITLGGLGFIVLKEIQDIITRKKSIIRLTVHSKVVLMMSATLVLAGTLMIFFGEFLYALDGHSLWEKIQISIFQSVTLRTAGFNTIDLTSLKPYTLYGMTLFMFIGGSPGSTAGGIKTTTLAILLQSIKSTLLGKKSVEILNRTIPSPMVIRATALTFISILITSFFILIVKMIEPDQQFFPIFFEVLSASGTVGLSLGVTPELSLLGKIAFALLMLIGRIGPLTLMLAISQKQRSAGKFNYPDGRIMIG